jgi:hypothetical protein
MSQMGQSDPLDLSVDSLLHVQLRLWCWKGKIYSDRFSAATKSLAKPVRPDQPLIFHSPVAVRHQVRR